MPGSEPGRDGPLSPGCHAGRIALSFANPLARKTLQHLNTPAARCSRIRLEVLRLEDAVLLYSQPTRSGIANA
jgi:hypothetical protein